MAVGTFEDSSELAPKFAPFFGMVSRPQRPQQYSLSCPVRIADRILISRLVLQLP